MGYNVPEIINVVGSYTVEDGYNNIIVIPATSVVITNATGSATFSTPISFGKNAGGNDSWLGFTVTGNCTIVKNGGSIIGGNSSGGGGGSATWGLITGTITNQTDLINYLIANYIPYANSNYRVVNANGTPAQNGTALIAALTAAYALTPNGSALSNNNRASVILFPGVYDLGASSLNIGNYVDIVSFGIAIGVTTPNTDVRITSSNASGTLVVAASNDYALSNMTIENTGGGNSISITTSDSGNWNSLNLYNSTTQDIDYYGTYTNINGNADLILAGNIYGNVKNCNFSSKSCGYSTLGTGNTITIAGNIENCVGGDNCFGGMELFVNTNVIISGIIKNCTSEQYSFGFGQDVTISGTISGCKARRLSFGASASSGTLTYTSASLIENCIGTEFNSFGRSDGNITMSGKMINCLFNSSSGGGFGFSLFGTVTISSTAIFLNCYGAQRCFGFGATMSNSGQFFNCSATTESFGSTTSSAVLNNCTRTGGMGTHAGKIKYCTFSDASGAALTIASGAVLKYNTFFSGGGTYTVTAGGAVTATIYMNSMNLNYDILITNSIATPYNVVDSNVTV